MIAPAVRVALLGARATARCAALVAALLAFFVVGAPLQWFLVTRLGKDGSWLPALFGRTVLRLCDVSVTVEGRPLADGPLLVLANHVSWIDVPALAAVRPFSFLAKREIATWPIVSTFAAVQGTVFVDRARRRSIPRANADMAARMASGRSVLLFPEGTTLPGPLPGPFRTSHVAAARDLLARTPVLDRVAVQPVAIGYSGDHAAWVGDETLAAHLWRVLTSAPLHCTLAFGAPVWFTRASDRKAVARTCREAIVTILAGAAAEPERAAPPSLSVDVIGRGRDAA